MRRTVRTACACFRPNPQCLKPSGSSSSEPICSTYLIDIFSSSSEIADLNPRIPSPKLLPSAPIFPGPKINSAMASRISSSGIPNFPSIFSPSNFYLFIPALPLQSLLQLNACLDVVRNLHDAQTTRVAVFRKTLLRDLGQNPVKLQITIRDDRSTKLRKPTL
jgi:hypothetical protein